MYGVRRIAQFIIMWQVLGRQPARRGWRKSAVYRHDRPSDVRRHRCFGGIFQLHYFDGIFRGVKGIQENSNLELPPCVSREL